MTTDLAADVVVVGAGPAGAATAALLAPVHRTLLLDRGAPTPPAGRIGESLPAAAARLLRDMGLWQDFQTKGHAPCHSASSEWGGPEATFVDSVRDPDGPGWHLDRAGFDEWLRSWAHERGAAFVTPAKLVSATATDGGWRLTVLRHGRPLTIAARFVVDAGGRAAPFAKLLGHRREVRDRLVCRWLHGVAAGDLGRRHVGAESDGWWYTAALPAGRRVLAFHTDADLPCAKETSEASGLLGRAFRQEHLASLLMSVGFEPSGPAGSCAAHGSALTIAAGAGWLAVGDAALSCDPLSSQGLLNALYFAMSAAAAIENGLAGKADALAGYQTTVDRVAAAYRDNLAACYALETRWRGRPFWTRRVPPRLVKPETFAVDAASSSKAGPNHRSQRAIAGLASDRAAR